MGIDGIGHGLEKLLVIELIMVCVAFLEFLRGVSPLRVDLLQSVITFPLITDKHFRHREVWICKCSHQYEFGSQLLITFKSASKSLRSG